jgi:hypothetical protein
MSRVLFFPLLLLLALGQALAAPTKCVVNGQTVYQDRPCGPSGTEVSMTNIGKDTMAGCYEFDYHGRKPGDPFQKFVITRDKKGNSNDLVLHTVNRGGVVMKPATADEIRNVASSFRVNLNDGYSLGKGLGIFRGKDERGGIFFLAHFHSSNGLARKAPCSREFVMFSYTPEVTPAESDSPRTYRRRSKYQSRNYD